MFQPAHADIPAFAELMRALRGHQHGESEFGEPMRPFGHFGRLSRISMAANRIKMGERVDAIGVKQPAMQIQPIETGD